jgi:3-hydroxy-9,10-secoandrosta-1,3,5(10)-triene-9,17-dione monooxygenase
MALLMPNDYEVIETWDSEGLKGTGSHDIKVVDQFVAFHRTVLSEDAAGTAPPGAALHSNYIYRVEFSPYFFTLVAGPMLGTAMGALEEYCELTKIRSGQMFSEPIVEQVPVQVRVGESAAEIHAAHLVVDNINQYLHKEGKTGRELSGSALITIRRDLAHASRQCLSAVTRLSGMMGVTAQSGRNSVQRHFRDCRTISTHGGLQWDGAMGPNGRLALGLKTGDPKVDDAKASPFLDRAVIN